MVNVEMLKHEIEDIGVSKTKLAEVCGFTRQTLDNKLVNPDTFTAADIYALTKALRISKERAMEIFFAPDVEKNGNKEQYL